MSHKYLRSQTLDQSPRYCCCFSTAM
jgi:hypothetical protein